MRNNGKSIWKITISIFTVLMIMTLLSAGASASISVKKTPLGAGTPPATQHLSCGCDRIDYTAVAASKSDPKIVRFKDLSKGKETSDLPQMSSKKEHFFCYRFQVITSKSETIISILTPKNRSEKSSAESQSRKM
jgi:hypothetical protein